MIGERIDFVFSLSIMYPIKPPNDWASMLTNGQPLGRKNIDTTLPLYQLFKNMTYAEIIKNSNAQTKRGC
jgi:hypothetical protein